MGKKKEKKHILGEIPMARITIPFRKTDKDYKGKKLTSTKRLSVLFVIVKKKKVDYYLDLIEDFGVNMQISMIGNGTTKSAIFSDEIGSKAIILSLVSEDNIKRIMSELSRKFMEVKDGKGVAWTVPLSSVMGVTFFNFLSNNVGSII